MLAISRRTIVWSLFSCWTMTSLVSGQDAIVPTTPLAFQEPALQDTTQSPSDAPQPEGNSATESSRQTGPAMGSISDAPSPQLQGPQPTPPSSPQVSSLGNNAFNSLTRSNFYASPFAAALGASRGTSNSALARYFNSDAHRSLLETPEMFGDLRRPGSAIFFDPSGGTSYDDEQARTSDFPSASSFSGMRVSENNVALPQDRVWFVYNHMHNAFMQPGGDLSLDRFTLGVEKTFHGGASSVEVRLPMAGSIEPAGNFGGTTEYAGGSFGNLSTILKHVLLASETRVIAVGLAVETPTGSRSHALDTQNGLVEITIAPTAVYLTPYLGTLRRIDDIWYVNSFLQVDVPTGGERLLASLNGAPAQEFFINKPVTLQIDIGGGVWLITPSSRRIGLALTSELHLTTALSENDSFQVDSSGGLPNVFVNQNGAIRNLLNTTTGLHAQLNDQWAVRTGISVPMLHERIFDTEVMVQVNRSY